MLVRYLLINRLLLLGLADEAGIPCFVDDRQASVVGTRKHVVVQVDTVSETRRRANHTCADLCSQMGGKRVLGGADFLLGMWEVLVAL